MLLEAEIALCRWPELFSWVAGGALGSSSQCLVVSSPVSQCGAVILGLSSVGLVLWDNLKSVLHLLHPSPDLIAEIVGKGKLSVAPNKTWAHVLFSLLNCWPATPFPSN